MTPKERKRVLTHSSPKELFAMNVIFTCGGTAGHVNPALALAGCLREKDPAARVLFVGTPNGMERGLIENCLLYTSPSPRDTR